MSALVPAAGLGLLLGVVTGMPLAVINVAIVEATTAGRRRFALGLGLGGGVADAIHAMLAFAGVGRIVLADPRLVRVLAIGAALVIITYVVVTWRRRARAAEPQVAAGPDDRRGRTAEAGDGAASAPAVRAIERATDPGHAARGVATGFLLTLPNPAALGAWVTVAAAAWPDASLAEAAAIAGGVGTGSAVWFTLLGRWIARVRPDHPAVAWIPRVALLLLLAIALTGVARAL